MSHKYFYYIFFWINSLEELDTSLSTEQLRTLLKIRLGLDPKLSVMATEYTVQEPGSLLSGNVT